MKPTKENIEKLLKSDQRITWKITSGADGIINLRTNILSWTNRDMTYITNLMQKIGATLQAYQIVPRGSKNNNYLYILLVFKSNI